MPLLPYINPKSGLLSTLVPGGIPESGGLTQQGKVVGGLLADYITGPIHRFYEANNTAVRSLLGGPPMTEEERNNLAAAMVENMGETGIVSPSVAKTLTTKLRLPKDEIFSQAVKNTPGAEITADGLIMNIQRNQLPEQALEPSVRGGVFYLPEGAAQGKHYSTGKNGYGGPEKISGETLVQNPLFVKGATGGKAPEAAYDSLLGKGSYENMRSDALRVFGRYGASIGEKEELAEKFLEKYAPELVGNGYYIVRNSGKGNQLAYALQEAAVASAVRRAGHDAVLGHSKGKSGPFLSELFDVREKSYPDPSGEYEIWEDLYK